MTGVLGCIALLLVFIGYKLEKIADELEKMRQSNESWRGYKENVYGQSTGQKYKGTS